MQRVGVNRLIFSSSCATFGSPTTFPITETTPQRPTNPYGQAKLQAEQAIVAFLRAQERQGGTFSAALLRYFNVVGADPEGRLGPHLTHAANARFPRILDAAYDVALGHREKLVVTGSDFPTKDGSAQRDYIHVSDLVDAHVQVWASRLNAAARALRCLRAAASGGVRQSLVAPGVVVLTRCTSQAPLAFALPSASSGSSCSLTSLPLLCGMHSSCSRCVATICSTTT